MYVWYITIYYVGAQEQKWPNDHAADKNFDILAVFKIASILLFQAFWQATKIYCVLSTGPRVFSAAVVGSHLLRGTDVD